MHQLMVLSRGRVVMRAKRAGPVDFVGEARRGQYLARDFSLLR